jgi:signal transduction histidine kinase
LTGDDGLSPDAGRLAEQQAARLLHAEAGREREAFLAQAGEVLAGSLDYATTLATVARLCVPRVADSCIVYLVEEDGRVERLAAAHRDPDRERALHAHLERRPFDPDSMLGPVARALRTGEPELIPDVAATWHGGEADAHTAPRSLMVVPLKLRDRVLGALSLGWDAQGAYAADALWLARKLADRAALAVENARLHREVRRALEVKSDFLAAMSHEFRTPLTAILAYAEFLVAGIPEPIADVPRGHAERILQAAQHLTHLVEQVLTLSRIEAERDAVHPAAVDVAALARDTAALVEPLARQKGLALRVVLPAGEPTLRTDADKLRQVLINLLGNAVKFTARGEVRLVLRTADSRAVVEVHDTGPGIAPEVIERIWEPFWQAERRAGAGSGLGLGITRRLVRLLGGTIRARSVPGEGSVFTVELGSYPQAPGGA